MSSYSRLYEELLRKQEDYCEEGKKTFGRKNNVVLDAYMQGVYDTMIALDYMRIKTGDIYPIFKAGDLPEEFRVANNEIKLLGVDNL